MVYLATPDAFDLTVTQLVYEATSGTSQARQIAGTQTRNAPRTATAEFWETQGVTPTPGDFELRATMLVFNATETGITRTQIAETAIASGCEQVIVDYVYQHRQIDFTENPVDVLSSNYESEGVFFDCPDILDIPDSQIDFTVDVIFPGDEIENINDYIVQAILLLSDYPFEATTLGTDNLALYVKANSYQFPAWFEMTFSYSEMLSALEDGLEAETLLEALGGIEDLYP